MKRIILSISILICFLLPGNLLLHNSVAEVQQEKPVPFGNTIFDLNLILEHTQSVPSAGTVLEDHVGKTYFYNLDKIQFLAEDLPDNIPIEFITSIAGSEVFFKVIREDTENIEVQPGFILGNDFNLSIKPENLPIEFPSDLLKIIFPENFSLILPTSINTIKNPKNQSITPINDNTGNLIPLYLNIFLDPNNWIQHDNEFSWALSEFTQEAQEKVLSSIEWDALDPADLPLNVFRVLDQYNNIEAYYHKDLSAYNNHVNLTLPSWNVYGAWETALFDEYASPIWNQPSSQLSQGFVEPRKVELTGVLNGTNITVVFNPQSFVYATNGQIKLYNDKVSEVYGVFRFEEYQSDMKWQDQVGTNFYLGGGSFTEDTITLGTDPGDNQSLVIVYRPLKYPIITSSVTYTPNTVFNITVDISSSTTMENGTISVQWDASSSTTQGWLESFYLNGFIDVNGNNTLEPWEHLEIEFSLDPTKTLTRSLPISEGDQGSYDVKTANLDINLNPGYQLFWDNFVNAPDIAEMETAVQDLQGLNLFNYSIQSVDGLYYSFPDGLPIPTSYSDKSLVINAFDTNVYENITINSFVESYLDLDEFQIFDLYNNTFSLPNGSFTDGYVVENISLYADGQASTYLPINGKCCDNLYVFNASEYLWSYSPTAPEQNGTQHYVEYWDDPTKLTVYNNSFDFLQLSAGEDIVVAYKPAKESYAAHGKVILGIDDPLEILGLYDSIYCCSDITGPNYFDGGSISGNVITLGPSAPSGVYPVFTSYKDYSYEGYHLYEPAFGDFYIPFALGSVVGFPNPLMPAKTPDWFVLENNVQAFNINVGNYKDAILGFIKELLDQEITPHLVPEEEYILNANIVSSLQKDSTTVRLAFYTELSGLFPLAKLLNAEFPFQADTEFSFMGSSTTWFSWSSEGITKEIGENIHIEIATEVFNPSTITPTSSSSSFTSSSSSTTSNGGPTSGFEYLVLLSAIPVLFIIRRRKT